ncbi:MAG: sigma 54-interacting transcriptional regulator [Pseudomonadota bacterium]
MEKILALIPLVASRDVTVLIQGPTGTGKDLLAKVIKEQSLRKTLFQRNRHETIARNSF